MSVHVYHPYPVAARLTIGLRVHAALAAIAGAVYEWNERGRQRRLLARLDDRMLRDIGLTRLDVEREVSKPFWRG